MKPCGFGNPSCTVRGTLPAGPRSVTYSRQPFDRYGISSSSRLRAWCTSQSMTGPEYINESSFLRDEEARSGRAPAPSSVVSLQGLDLIRADLVGHRVTQDL